MGEILFKDGCVFMERREEARFNFIKEVKTESTRKLSNFNFQWTKTLYQNNLKNIGCILFSSLRAKDEINHL